MPLELLERSWRWAGFNGIHLVRFGFKMWEILILKWFLQLKIQINSKKPSFGEEKSVEDVVTLGANGTGHTSKHEIGIAKGQKLKPSDSSNSKPSSFEPN